MKSLFTIVALFVANISFSQSIVNVSPNIVAPGTITGTISFEGNLTFWNTGAGLYQIKLIGPNDVISPASQNIIDDTNAECTFLIPSTADTGCYDVQAYDIIADTVWMICGMTVSNTAGINDLSTSNSVTLYPNPLKEVSILEIITPNQGEYIIDFYDVLGRKTNTITSLESKVLLKRDNFETGAYYYTVSNLEGTISKGKILVE